MNTLTRLEKGGVLLELAADGQITWRAVQPGDVPQEWLRPLLAELRAQRAAVTEILRRRQAWIEAYDEWCRQTAAGGDDPQRDAAYLQRLAGLAVAAQLPCYDGGQTDLGAAGWQRVTERQIQQILAEERNEMGIKIEQTTYEAIPTGEYKAIITNIEQAEGKFGPQLQIKCEVNAGPYAGNTFLCWASPKFSPKSRLYEWVEAAMAMPVPKSYTFDSDHLIGREVMATLVVRELDGGGEVNRVDRVRAVSKEKLPFAE